MDAVALFASGIAAGAVLLLVVGLFGPRQRQVVQRLAHYGSSPQELQSKGPKAERPNIGQLLSRSAALATLNRAVERRTWSEDFARDLARADLALKPVEFLALRVTAIVAAVAICLLLGLTVLPTLLHPLVLVGAALLGFWLPRFYVRRRQAKRLRAFNSHLADSITLIANALRSGASLLQAIEMVVRETQPPISTEFNRVIREVNLGLPLEQAVNSMVRRVRSDDMELMASAIAIHHQVGGNLAEILDTIAFTIRERVRIKGEIRTLTAQQRLSGYVVGFLPVGLMLTLWLLLPRFMNPMFEKPPALFGIPLGVILLALGAVLMGIGFAAIRRIVEAEI